MKTEPKLTRHSAREKVLQSLYAVEISKEIPDLVFAYIFEGKKSDSDEFIFAKSLFNLTIRNKIEYSELIDKKLKNWKFDRITLIDKIILQMSLCELMDFADIPPKVTINEAITLAKSFSTDESGKFVNGILDSLYQQLTSENKLVKTGRGLLNNKKK